MKLRAECRQCGRIILFDADRAKYQEWCECQNLTAIHLVPKDQAELCFLIDAGLCGTCRDALAAQNVYRESL
jgi:hypothetical protein